MSVYNQTFLRLFYQGQTLCARGTWRLPVSTASGHRHHHDFSRCLWLIAGNFCHQALIGDVWSSTPPPLCLVPKYPHGKKTWPRFPCSFDYDATSWNEGVLSPQMSHVSTQEEDLAKTFIFIWWRSNILKPRWLISVLRKMSLRDKTAVFLIGWLF